jgi:hypothetical protein
MVTKNKKAMSTLLVIILWIIFAAIAFIALKYLWTFLRSFII